MKVINSVFLFGGLIGMSVIGVIGYTVFFDREKYVDSEKIITDINGEEYRLEVAISEKAQRKGLMERFSLAQDRGMIFIYAQEDMRSFWMKDTLIPLDIIFLDKHREVVHIEEQVPPCQEDPCPSYSSQYPSQYVIELNAGEADKVDLTKGQRISWDR